MSNPGLENQFASLFADSAPGAEFSRDPYPFFEKLLSAAPYFYHEERAAWVIRRYQDVVRLLGDERVMATSSFADQSPLFRSTVVQRLRGLFTAPQIYALQPMVDRVVAAQLQRVLAMPSADLVEDFAKVIPMAVMAELLGIPQADWLTLQKLAASVLDAYDLSWEGHPRPHKAMRSMLHAYFSKHYAATRSGPATPLMTMLLDEQREHALPEESMVDACLKLVTAGSATTAGCLANILVRLVTKSDISTMGGDLDLRNLTDELLRLETPILAVKRVAHERIELEHAVIEPGSRIYLLVASANRDPAVFTSPHCICLNRPSRPHLSFGPGRYHCLGAALAKLEVLGTLKEVIPVLGRMRLRRPVAWRPGWLVHEAQKLEVMIDE